ncbi:MAG TPA: aminopeptidase, partial [candidate division Zixibacteria bacterium]|nr:aminopeptidase [candidate division Zixibacteria bacterium]
DPPTEKLAQVLVHYSLRLKKGELLKIQGEYVTLPLMTAVFEEAVRIGAIPYVRVIIPQHDEIFLKKGTDAQFAYISPIARTEVNTMDVFLHIWGTANTRHLSGVDPKRQALQRKCQRPLSDKLFKRMETKSLRWCGTLFPAQAEAQEASMSLAEWENFVYRAGHVTSGDPVKHWTKVKKEQDRLVKILNRTDRLHIRSADTDLKMRVKGRKWINCAGTENFPDGEVFTCPIEDSAEGVIRFSFPAIYVGREVEDVRLELKKGKVVKESAAKNQAYLTGMLNMDKGARYVGEIAIGTNYDIDRFSKDILFDEKIGGTLHMALGRAFAEAGGKNVSALHWDMICDMRKDAEVLADGKVIYRNGKFTI